MATIKELEDALIKADAAGQTGDARIFAAEIERLRGQAPTAPEVSVVPETSAAPPAVPRMARYDVAGAPNVRIDTPGTQTMLREMGTSMGAATAGQLVGSAAGPVGTSLGGGVGAGVGNLVNQLQRMAEDPNYKFQWGEFIADVGTGMVPGAPLAAGVVKGGAKPVIREAVKQGVTTLAGAETQSLIDRGQFLGGKEAGLAFTLGSAGGAAGQRMQAGSKTVQAAVAEQQAGRSMRSRAADAGAELGLKASPAEIEAVSQKGVGFGTKQAASAAGADALKFELQLQNQKAVNKAVKTELGVPQNKDVSIDTLRKIREEAGEVYAEVGKVGEKGKTALENIEELRRRHTLSSDPMERARLEDEFAKAFESTKNKAEIQAAADVAELSRLRGESRRQRQLYYSSEGANTVALEKSLLAREQAQALELSIEKAVEKAGQPELAEKLRKARERIAKSYDAEDALNVATGDFDARVFGRKLDQGKPLSGNFETIGAFQQAFKNAFGDTTRRPVAGVSKLGLLGRTVLAGTTYGGTQNIPLTLAAAVAPEAAGEASRRYLLSSGRQQRALETLRPEVKATPPLASVATRMAAQEAGETAAEAPPITRSAVDFLIANPETAKAFDEKYGPGLARRFLKASEEPRNLGNIYYRK